MIRKPVGTLTAAVLALGLGVLAAPLQTTVAAAAVARPASIPTVTAEPGPKPGEVTISWTHDGKNTTRYEVETGLTSFSRTDASMPLHARGWKVFTAPASARTLTLTAEQTAAAGAPVGSANHLYFRLRAVNSTSSGEEFRDHPYLQTVGVAPAVPAATGTPLRVGTFNVRTARATTDKQTWLQRVPAVSKQILDHRPGVLALQELGPGRADGATGSTTGLPRQTDSLLTELAKQGGSRYKLIQTTPYVKSGTEASTQGMRILYDSSKYTMLSACADKTGSSLWNDVCTVALPIRSSGDTPSDRRKAVYSLFADKTTGEKFYFISAHLDARHSDDVAVERTLDQLRTDQITTAVDAVDRVNTEDVPVIVGSDINTWQNHKVGYGAHDALIAKGFYDTAAAQKTTNLRYTTMNAFNTTLPDPGKGFGSRLDVVAAKGITGAVAWENVMKPTDSARPSDHNMIVADLRLPTDDEESGSGSDGSSSGGSGSDGSGSGGSGSGGSGDSTTPDARAYRPLTATRLVDTRNGTGAKAAQLPAKGTLDVAVTGRAGIPSSGVGAVVVNITALGARSNGSLTAYPTGQTRGSASTLSFGAGAALANSVVLKPGTDGKIRLYSTVATDVLVDVQGWFPTASDFTPLTGARVLDTRNGTGAPTGVVGKGKKIDLVVTGRGGVPATGVDSVVLNLMSTGATTAGSAKAYPAGSTQTSASSLQYPAGRTTANGVVVKVGKDGKVSLYVSAGTHLIADVQGWFATRSDLVGLNPARVLDTRSGTGAPAAAVAAKGSVDLQVTGREGVPATGVKAVVLNVTATSPAGTGFVSSRATGAKPTSATNLALVSGRNIADRVIVPVSADGQVTLDSTVKTHLVADVVGYVTD
jgi:endonuclease/exonuclease/phosphatase family metal-dependent hydrolase